jgi:hypothetical protein
MPKVNNLVALYVYMAFSIFKTGKTVRQSSHFFVATPERDRRSVPF